MNDRDLGARDAVDASTKAYVPDARWSRRRMPKSKAIFLVEESRWKQAGGTMKARRSVKRSDAELVGINVWVGGTSGGAPLPGVHPLGLSARESELFLRIASQALRVKRHYELFQMLQGEVQHFIPHQVLISAWGDFGGSDLQVDVISALPGVRTARLGGCNVDSLLKDLHDRWLAHGRQPVLMRIPRGEQLACNRPGCSLHRALQKMGSILVHGVNNLRDGFDSLYLAFNSGAIASENDLDRVRLLVEPVVAQLDSAFRRVAALKRADERPVRHGINGGADLSPREGEILKWIAEGRTNAEISRILSISSFTVKNHVQRIIRKLGVANRTEAATRYRGAVERARAAPRDEPVIAVAAAE
jgi:transcriptional regulator EpsA